MHSASDRRLENQHSIPSIYSDENQGNESLDGQAIFSLDKYLEFPLKPVSSNTKDCDIPQYSLAVPMKWERDGYMDFGLIVSSQKHEKRTELQNYTQLLIWCLSARLSALQTKFRTNDTSSSTGMPIMTIKKVRSKLQQLCIKVSLNGKLGHPPHDLYELANLKVCLDGASAHINPQVKQIHEYMKALRHQELQQAVLLNRKSRVGPSPAEKLETEGIPDPRTIGALYNTCVNHLARAFSGLEKEIVSYNELLRTKSAAKLPLR